MSLTGIFIVGIAVFALTVWGTVMIGGYWLTEVTESHEDRPDPGSGSPSTGE